MKMTPEELFDSFTPALGDKDRYIEELSKKLESVEMLHRICEENARKTKAAVLVAALIGLLFGGVIMAIVFWGPTFGMDFSFKLGIQVMNFTIHYSFFALFLLTAVPICLLISLFLREREQIWK